MTSICLLVLATFLPLQASYDNLAGQESWGAEAGRDAALSALPCLLADYYDGKPASSFISERLITASAQASYLRAGRKIGQA